MKLFRRVAVLIDLLFQITAWNRNGHFVVASIAYDNLTPSNLAVSRTSLSISVVVPATVPVEEGIEIVVHRLVERVARHIALSRISAKVSSRSSVVASALQKGMRCPSKLFSKCPY